ncbi:Cation/H+ exchanger [Mycena amicta]|nr:Cation/H+ exchanger [Mycena amicta]
MTVAYSIPSIPLTLTVSSFIFLINVGDAVLAHLLNAGLLGSLIVGIVFGPDAADILPPSLIDSFTVIGYLGLLLIVFEAGLTTDVGLLFDNIMLSCAIALSGMLLPIGLSMILLHFAFGYPTLQAFGAGAALSSTSLGTTLAVLSPSYRRTRTGTVLLAAALLDDVGGLVIAGILARLASYEPAGTSRVIPWYIILRPVLVSFGFAFGVPLLAYILRRFVTSKDAAGLAFRPVPQVWLLIITLLGFVAGAGYAGTSELFGSYLAGALMAYVFAPTSLGQPTVTTLPPQLVFTNHIAPLLKHIFSPLFFASIGSALPIRALGSVNGSSRVVWRGILYSILMVISKALVGLWILVWPNRATGRGWFASGASNPLAASSEETTMEPQLDTAHGPLLSPDLPPIRAALLVGLAMIARGEIALIVAQIARPLLDWGRAKVM